MYHSAHLPQLSTKNYQPHLKNPSRCYLVHKNVLFGRSSGKYHSARPLLWQDWMGASNFQWYTEYRTLDSFSISDDPSTSRRCQISHIRTGSSALKRDEGHPDGVLWIGIRWSAVLGINTDYNWVISAYMMDPGWLKMLVVATIGEGKEHDRSDGYSKSS